MNKEEGKKIIKDAPEKTYEKNKTWEDIQRALDVKFFKNEHNHNDNVFINPHEYNIDKETIIDVLEDKGYNVKEELANKGQKFIVISLK